jgi:hypothetical protein
MRRLDLLSKHSLNHLDSATMPRPFGIARHQDLTRANAQGQPATAQSSWWVTTSPFITKDDFQR